MSNIHNLNSPQGGASIAYNPEEDPVSNRSENEQSGNSPQFTTPSGHHVSEEEALWGYSYEDVQKFIDGESLGSARSESEAKEFCQENGNKDPEFSRSNSRSDSSIGSLPNPFSRTATPEPEENPEIKVPAANHPNLSEGQRRAAAEGRKQDDEYVKTSRDAMGEGDKLFSQVRARDKVTKKRLPRKSEDGPKTFADILGKNLGKK